MAEPLRRRVRARALAGLTRVAAPLPSGLVRAGLGGLASLSRFTRYERVVRSNLELALGAETSAAERARIARGVRRHSARLGEEWLRLSRSGAPGTPNAARGDWIDAAVELDGSIEILHDELARGRGAIVVTAHVGNWELCCARLARLGLEGAVVGYRKPNDPSGRWLADMRRAYGVTTLPQTTSARELVEGLRRGATLGLLADLEVRRLAGAFLPFFGVPALTMTAPAALARAHRAPLVPVRCIARDGGRGPYELCVDPPLAIDRGLPRKAATLELTERLNGLFERWIRAAPEQWAWHQRRWRTRPGEHVPVPLAERLRGRAPRREPPLQSVDPRLARP